MTYNNTVSVVMVYNSWGSQQIYKIFKDEDSAIANLKNLGAEAKQPGWWTLDNMHFSIIEKEVE